MKNKLMILLVGLGLLFPLSVKASTLTFNGEPTETTATYEIIYNPETDPKNTIILEIDKTNDDLVYELSSEFGTCNGMECTLITEQINVEAKIATLKVTNNTTEAKETTITINGTIPGDTKTFTLKPSEVQTTQAPLSDDCNLNNLSISIGTMDQAFNKDLTNYIVTGIKDTVNTVRITPDCEKCTWKMYCPNGECSIKNTNIVQLQIGVNKVSVVVTSEDLKNNKTYLLTIYRGEIELNSAYLENIIIKDTILSPNFDSMVNDYTATVGLDINKLEIDTIAEDPNATVVIKGNENLKVGENTITITVTSNDGQNKQVYTIIVTKEEIEEEKKEEIPKEEIKTNKVEKKENNTVLIIVLSIIALLLIIGAYIIIFKRKKNKKDKNNKNNKNNGNNKDNKNQIEELPKEKEKTTKEKIEDATKELIIPNIENEPKQDIDEALEDLMKTKQLELGDIEF